ncbi:MAG: hypothetical protein J6C42_03120, partial [Clostridia bacterium]|nr:hypothetical protein [Clostridia bacterium]
PGGGGDSGAQVQADWNQDDSAAADYVKNRPFYKGMMDVLPETELTFELNENAGVPTAGFTPEFLPDVGEECVVIFSGTKYICSAIDVPEDGMEGRYVGNLVILGGDDSGEPFGILMYEGMAMVISLSGSTTETVSIRAPGVKTIEPEYLPSLGENPIFNLIEAGLPSVNNDAKVSCSVDSAMIRTILKEMNTKGFVRFRMNFTATCPILEPGVGNAWMTLTDTAATLTFNAEETDGYYPVAYACLSGYLVVVNILDAEITASLMKFTEMNFGN